MNTAHFGFGDHYFPTSAGKLSPARYAMKYEMSRKAKFRKDPKTKLHALEHLSICWSKPGRTVLSEYLLISSICAINKNST